MRRTGAQEHNNYFKPKATNISLSRLAVELNLRSYERNRSLFSTMKITEICNWLEKWKLQFSAGVPFGPIEIEKNQLERELRAFNYDTFVAFQDNVFDVA